MPCAPRWIASSTTCSRRSSGPYRRSRSGSRARATCARESSRPARVRRAGRVRGPRPAPGARGLLRRRPRGAARRALDRAVLTPTAWRRRRRGAGWRRPVTAAGLEPRTLYRLGRGDLRLHGPLSTPPRRGLRRRALGARRRAPRPPAPARGAAAAPSAGARHRARARRGGRGLAPGPDARGARVPRRAGHAVAARLPVDALVARVGGMGYAIVPDPDAPGRRATLEHALRDVRAALGPTVGPGAAAVSARHARLALTLVADERGLVLAQERRVDLLLLQDPALADLLVADVLGPLAALSAGARVRLEETLAAWLRHQGEVRPVADELQRPRADGPLPRRPAARPRRRAHGLPGRPARARARAALPAARASCRPGPRRSVLRPPSSWVSRPRCAPAAGSGAVAGAVRVVAVGDRVREAVEPLGARAHGVPGERRDRVLERDRTPRRAPSPCRAEGPPWR